MNGGTHHQGPLQANEGPGAGDVHFYNKCSKNYGVGRVEVQILCNEERTKIMSIASKRTKDWLKEILQEVWPPSSFNYSLLDYFVRGVSEL